MYGLTNSVSIHSNGRPIKLTSEGRGEGRSHESGSGGCFNMAAGAECVNGNGIYWIRDSILTFLYSLAC